MEFPKDQDFIYFRNRFWKYASQPVIRGPEEMDSWRKKKLKMNISYFKGIAQEIFYSPVSAAYLAKEEDKFTAIGEAYLSIV